MKEAICEIMGRHVAKRRMDRDLTQDELATKAGISRQALSEIERGTQAPRWETLYALAGALGCEPWDIIPSLKQVRSRG